MKISTLLLFGFFCPIALGAKVIYVKKDATGQNNGSSWADAFQELKTALPTAQFGDEIWVAKGEYPSLVVGDSSFVMVSGARLLGGFAGWETEADQRDWVANETILTGKAAILPAPNVIFCMGTAPGTLIDGFTIRDGNARPPFFGGNCDFGALGQHNCHGGGIFLYSNDPDVPTWLTVRNCRFVDNNAYYGGGLSAHFHHGSGGLTVKNCFFQNVANTGGGMHLEISKDLPPVFILVDSCVFEGNSAIVDAAAQVLGGSNIIGAITFSNCVFHGNTASMNAGAIWGGAFKVKNCLFEGNQVLHFAGGGGALMGGGFIVETCEFKNNQAARGGAILGSRLSITESVFVNNKTTTVGGAIQFSGDNHLVNNIFIGNYAEVEGGALFRLNAQSDTIINCIFIGNRAGQSGDWSNRPFQGNTFMDHCYVDASDCSELLPDSTQPSTFVLHCGENMYFADTDPMLRDTASGDYGLMPCSPLVNAGSNVWAERFCGPTDLAGNPRISEGTVDIGAFESQYGFAVVPTGITPSCAAQATGTAAWAFEPGCPPYSYEWSGGSGTGLSVSGLSADDHPFTFTDGRGRHVEAVLSVGQLAPLSLNTLVTPASSSGAADGSIFTAVTMGLPPYTYLWNTGATTASLLNLSPADYSLTVTDGSGCAHSYVFEVGYTSSIPGIDSDFGFSLRPNPAVGSVQVRLARSVLSGAHFLLHDLSGRQVLTVPIPEGTLVYTVPLPGVPEGLYVLSVVEGGRVLAREKLVVLGPRS